MQVLFATDICFLSKNILCILYTALIYNMSEITRPEAALELLRVLFGIYLMTVTFSLRETLVLVVSLPSSVTFRVTVVALLVALPVGSRFL